MPGYLIPAGIESAEQTTNDFISADYHQGESHEPIESIAAGRARSRE
jgi:hypothetical protein